MRYRELLKKISKCQVRLVDKLEAALKTKGAFLKKTKRKQASTNVSEGLLVSAANLAACYLQEEVYGKNISIQRDELELMSYHAYEGNNNIIKNISDTITKNKKEAIKQYFKEDRLLNYVFSGLKNLNYPSDQGD